MAISPLRKWLLRLLIVLLILVLSWLGCATVVVYRLTRRPDSIQVETVPTTHAIAVTPYRLTTQDGEVLGAWYIDGAPTTPVVLLLHGNGSSRSSMLKIAEMIANESVAVLLISFRAHGDSTGHRNDFGYSGRHDVLAAVEWLEKNQPDRPIVILGQSLGSAAALFAAESLSTRVQGYILECPYQDIRTAVRNRMAYTLPRVLDRVAYRGLVVVSPMFLPTLNKLSPLNASEKVAPTVPVLVLAGGADLQATPAEAQAICERIPGPTELITFENARHLKLFETDYERYRYVVLEFIGKVKK